MHPLRIVTFLSTCLLAAVVTDGRAVRNKTAPRLKNRITWRVYLEENANRMVLTTEKNGKINDCYISGDNYMIAIALRTLSGSRIIRLDSRMMSSLAQYCTYAKWNKTLGSSGEEVYQELGIMSGMFIYPGTKWCGAGNVSESYDDLGPEVETDTCCRDHDHCEDSIEGFGSKYGLDNNSPFTKSNCNCDEKFYDCLRESNTRSSNRVGKIFFNYIRMECFKLEHPIRSCSKYKGYFRPRCIEYDLDEEQKPIWQFFDAKEYEPIDEEERRKNAYKQQDVFEYMLASPSQICNRTTDELQNKDRTSNYLVNLTLKDILSNATRQPVEGVSQKTKGRRFEKEYLRRGLLTPC